MVARIGSYSSGSSGTPTAVTFPQAPTQGNLLIIAVQQQMTAAPTVVPTVDQPGWNAIVGINFVSGINNHRQAYFWKFAGASETAPNITTGAGITCRWICSEWAGLSAHDVDGAEAGNASANTLTTNATPTLVDNWSFTCLWKVNSNAVTWTGPTTDLSVLAVASQHFHTATRITSSTSLQSAQSNWTTATFTIQRTLVFQVTPPLEVTADRTETFAATADLLLSLPPSTADRPETFASTADLLLSLPPLTSDRPETFAATADLELGTPVTADRPETFASTADLLFSLPPSTADRPETFTTSAALVLSAAPPGTQQTGDCWTAALEHVGLCGGGLEETAPGCTLPPCHGCLTEPPDGLGLPDLRTADTAYIARDGVQHHSDFYEPRIVTLQAVVGGDCGPSTVREGVSTIVQAWKRRCDDTELVIWPPSDCACDGPAAPDTARPLGIIGRPRVARVAYVAEHAELLLRFDARDHLMYLLDCCGNPGSGGDCVTLTPRSERWCRTFPVCFDACFPIDQTEPGTGPQTATVAGTECVSPTVTLTGPLTNPVIENTTTGATLTYNGVVNPGSVVTIDTSTGEASEDGSPRTHLVSGTLGLIVGGNTLTMRSFGSDINGQADVCWRPAVIVA